MRAGEGRDVSVFGGRFQGSLEMSSLQLRRVRSSALLLCQHGQGRYPSRFQLCGGPYPGPCDTPGIIRRQWNSQHTLGYSPTSQICLIPGSWHKFDSTGPSAEHSQCCGQQPAPAPASLPLPSSWRLPAPPSTLPSLPHPGFFPGGSLASAVLHKDQSPCLSGISPRQDTAL